MGAQRPNGNDKGAASPGQLIENKYDWSVMCVDYDGMRFSAADSATVAGTGALSLSDLKADMERMGLNADYVPEEDFGEFTTSSLAELDSSLDLITRATAWVDVEAVAEAAFREMQEGSNEWGMSNILANSRLAPIRW